MVDVLHYCGTKLSSKDMVEKRVEWLSKPFTPEDKDVIDGVVDVYKTWTGGELITLMHREGTPWKRHYINNYTGIIIPDEDTKNYYT